MPANASTTTPIRTVTKRRYASTFSPTPPTPRIAKKEFWTAQIKNIPSFTCNPWEYYDPLLVLGSGVWLVLCNDKTEGPVMKTYSIVSPDDEAYCFPEIQYPNFVNTYERYLFQNTNFVITEYVGFSIDDLLRKSIYPTEREIAYIVSQVLAGIQFIWSRCLDHPRISTRNIFVSSKGEVKIDLTAPNDVEHSSADLSSLGTVMVLMMDEARETLKSTMDWSAEAVNFVEATSSTTPNELSDHVFIAHAGGIETLSPLITLAQVVIWKDKCIDQDARKKRK